MKLFWKRFVQDQTAVRELRYQVGERVQDLTLFFMTSQVIQETKDITVLNQKGIEQIVQHLNQKDRLDLMKWISPTNTAMKQDDKLKLWLNGTGRWFLEPNEFVPWSNQDQDQTMWRTLFCPSAPGTGKTLMISGVIGEIQIVAYGTIVRSDWRISTATIARD